MVTLRCSHNPNGLATSVFGFHTRSRAYDRDPMPRKGPAYAISKEWRALVLTRIKEMNISQNELARRAKISKAAISEALDEESIQTTVMPQIHRALGWHVPPLTLSPDQLELLALYDQMLERDQGAMVERARTSVETAKRLRGR